MWEIRRSHPGRSRSTSPPSWAPQHTARQQRACSGAAPLVEHRCCRTASALFRMKQSHTCIRPRLHTTLSGAPDWQHCICNICRILPQIVCQETLLMQQLQSPAQGMSAQLRKNMSDHQAHQARRQPSALAPCCGRLYGCCTYMPCGGGGGGYPCTQSATARQPQRTLPEPATNFAAALAHVGSVGVSRVSAGQGAWRRVGMCCCSPGAARLFKSNHNLWNRLASVMAVCEGHAPRQA